MTMSRPASAIAAALCLLVCHPAPAREPVVPVSKPEAEQWLRWVAPLPKRVVIESKRIVPLAEVTVRVLPSAGSVERLAAEHLRALLGQAKPVQPVAGNLEIVLGVCDTEGHLDGKAIPNAAELTRLPNREQAYVIAPLDDNTIALAGLDPRGVSYAARTFGPIARLKDRQRQGGSPAGASDRLAGPWRARAMVVPSL